MEKVLTFIRNQDIPVHKSHEEIAPLEVQEILNEIEGEPSGAFDQPDCSFVP